MVLRLCSWRSHNLLPTFGTFHELENSLRMPINGLGNLMGSLGGPRKPTWRWNLKFFFMESISIIKGATTVKKKLKKFKDKKVFFCSNTTSFYSVQCKAFWLHILSKSVFIFAFFCFWKVLKMLHFNVVMAPQMLCPETFLE